MNNRYKNDLNSEPFHDTGFDLLACAKTDTTAQKPPINRFTQIKKLVTAAENSVFKSQNQSFSHRKK